MAKKINIKQLFDSYRNKVNFIDSYLNSYDKQIQQLQREMAMYLVSQYAPLLATKDGYIILNSQNAKLLGELDKVFALFKERFALDTFKETGNAMLRLTGLTSDYFRSQNTTIKTLKNIEDKLKKMQFTIGIDSAGDVMKGSFIDNLANTPQAKSLLADFVRKSIEGEVPYKDFVSGMKDIIEGTEGINGVLERYSGQYVHDAMYSHSQSVDNFFAEELGLEQFYYAGDIIKTSRPFCMGGYDTKCGCTFETKAGKTFTKEEAIKWNDLDWEGKIPGEDFFTQRGGYSCRHNLMWIPSQVNESEMSEEDPNL